MSPSLLSILATVEPSPPPPADSLGTAAQLGTWLVLLAGMAVLPFALTMVTSFAKLVVVFGIVRQALGTQQIPPNTVITGLALILTVHVSWPVAEEAIARYEASAPVAEVTAKDVGDAALVQRLRRLVDAGLGPMDEHLVRNAGPGQIALFEDLREDLRLRAAERREALPTMPATPASEEAGEADPDASADPILAAETRERAVRLITVHAPAFVLTELTEAFQVGFLIFVPFLVLDLVVANVLLAMGMHMLSPQTISLPLKILLFVLVDGWALILTGLVSGYA